MYMSNILNVTYEKHKYIYIYMCDTTKKLNGLGGRENQITGLRTLYLVTNRDIYTKRESAHA